MIHFAAQVLLNEGETAEHGQRIADDLMNKLEINKSDLLTGAYMEMVLANDSHKQNAVVQRTDIL